MDFEPKTGITFFMSSPGVNISMNQSNYFVLCSWMKTFLPHTLYLVASHVLSEQGTSINNFHLITKWKVQTRRSRPACERQYVHSTLNFGSGSSKGTKRLQKLKASKRLQISSENASMFFITFVEVLTLSFCVCFVYRLQSCFSVSHCTGTKNMFFRRLRNFSN